MAQKLALVPEQYLIPNRMRNTLEYRMEDDIDSLLNSKNIPDDNKVKLLSNLVSRYKKIVHSPYEPIQVSITPTTNEEETDTIKSPKKSETQIEEDEPIIRQILLSLPQISKKFVSPLVEKMKKADMSWNERGELMIGGKYVPGSHIVDIFSFMMRNRRNVDVPTGFPLFFQNLIKQGIPLEWIQNAVLKKNEMDEQKAHESLLHDTPLKSSNPPPTYFTPLRAEHKSRQIKRSISHSSRRSRSRTHSPGRKWLNY